MTRCEGGPRIRLPSTPRGATRELAALGDDPRVDVLVIGGGITGAGLALDAASRGLRTVLVERHDLAFGTSRWSSKLVARRPALPRVRSGRHRARERRRAAHPDDPHRAAPHAPARAGHAALRAGAYGARGIRRRRVRAGRRPAPAGGNAGCGAARARPDRPRGDAAARSGRAAATRCAAAMRGWDGQLIDDARLVVAVARTAAGFGAPCSRAWRPRVAGDGATLRDTLTGETMHVRARAVLGAAGVWAGQLDADVHVRPSRGTHLVVDSARLGWSDVSLTVPVPGSPSRFVFTVPALHGRTYIGITDVPADGPVPDVPVATDAEIDMLLGTVNTVLAEPLTRSDVVATFAGLRPCWPTPAAARTRPATSRAGTPSSSRTQACSAWSAASSRRTGGWRRTVWMPRCAAASPKRRPPSRTRDIPLVGAWPRERLGEIAAPARLVRRYGAEAPFVARHRGGPGRPPRGDRAGTGVGRGRRGRPRCGRPARPPHAARAGGRSDRADPCRRRRPHSRRVSARVARVNP